jgi:hypothetical protein
MKENSSRRGVGYRRRDGMLRGFQKHAPQPLAGGYKPISHWLIESPHPYTHHSFVQELFILFLC